VAAVSLSISRIGNYAFDGCDNLTNIFVEAGNPQYSSVDGVLFDRSKATLIQFPGGKRETYFVPNGVTTIGFAAFGNCSNLTSVTIPKSVTRIENEAFFGCFGIAALYFLGNAPALESAVFYSNSKAVAYYQAGTDGWGAALSGLPTQVWLAPTPLSIASLAVNDNGFGFAIKGALNQVVVVEACTNLANPVWSTAQTITISDTVMYFSDPPLAGISGAVLPVARPLIPPPKNV
jgi:hypothetical protein